jgi:PadR family transcriptional regulator, regulatory protein PadR
MKREDDQDSIPRLSNKESIVLELLIDNPMQEMYGLELMEKSGERLKRGTIYVTLGRMEDKGFVSSRQETEHPSRPGVPRRLYRPTGYGMRVYAAWSQVRDQRFRFADHPISGTT